jgi:hypothetical protein
MGISLSYPDSIEAQPIGISYRSMSENVEFISANETVCFQIELIYEKFNKYNHSEYSFGGSDEVYPADSSLILSVNALPAPIPFPIENIGEIMVNGTPYYTYSIWHTQRIQRDILIYPRGSYYYKFTFLGQDKDFIMKLMSSVRYINSTDLDLSGALE